MNVHKNARLTPSGRVFLVQRIEQGWPVGRAAEASGVSARTAYRWLSRYRGGDRQLRDRSSAPRRCPHRLDGERIGAISALRRQRMTGPAIARALGLSRSTVGLVLRRLGLNRPALLEPRPAAMRYERRPGEMINPRMSESQISSPGMSRSTADFVILDARSAIWLLLPQIATTRERK